MKKYRNKKSKIKTDGIFILRESSDPEQLVPGLEIEKLEATK